MRSVVPPKFTALSLGKSLCTRYNTGCRNAAVTRRHRKNNRYCLPFNGGIPSKPTLCPQRQISVRCSRATFNIRIMGNFHRHSLSVFQLYAYSSLSSPFSAMKLRILYSKAWKMSIRKRAFYKNYGVIARSKAIGAGAPPQQIARASQNHLLL